MKGAVFTAPFFWDFTQILRSFCIVLLYFCPNFSYYLHWGFYMGRPEKFSGLPSFYENPYVFY